VTRGSYSYPDHILSIFQSAAAHVLRQQQAMSLDTGAGSAPAGQPDLLKAATEIAGIRMQGKVASSGGEPARRAVDAQPLAPADLLKLCASKGLQYLEARLAGDQATADRLKAEMTDSSCDPLWLTALEQYLIYFGPDGTRAKVPYVTPKTAGETTIRIPSGATIGLIGDWGTGGGSARRILQELKAQKPDIVIHVGDIYYSGTAEECATNFEAIVNDVFERDKTDIPVYTLAGNHDVYSGGVGYYDLIKRLNKGPLVQPASFFCLRTEDATWQFLAMDTGLHDYDPFTVTDAVTFVTPEEVDWHRRRIAEFAGHTVLLSHHQLFSALSPIGKADDRGRRVAYNPKLRQTFETLQSTGKPIPAWFWGHEHTLGLYLPYLGLAKGRCIGCGAIPIFVEENPYDSVDGLIDSPTLMPESKLSIAGDVYTNAFATLSITREGPIEVRYFEDSNGNSVLKYSETIDAA
jgi:hypothetical protein